MAVRYRDPFDVLPGYRPGHWDSYVMYALEALAAAAVERDDRDLLAGALAAQSIACRGGVHWLWGGGPLSALVGDDRGRELCLAAVRGRPRKALSARGQALLGLIEALRDLGLIEERTWMQAAFDPWRRKHGMASHAHPNIVGLLPEPVSMN